MALQRPRPSRINPLQAPEIFENVRIPLVGSPSSRPAVSGAFISAKDQHFINVVLHRVANPATNQETVYINKRPGFKLYATRSNGAGTAIQVWNGVNNGGSIIAAFGSTNSKIFNDSTDLGNITGLAKSIDETDITGTSTMVIPSTDNTGWFYPTGGALTRITDADFPGNAGRTIVGRFVFMDGYCFIMDSTGRIYNSDLNSLTNWTATSFLSPTFYTSDGVGLARHKDAVVAFSKTNHEFFVNSGSTTGSPLTRRDIIVSQIGAVLPADGLATTIVNHGDDIYFVGMTSQGGAGIFRIQNFKTEMVSNAIVDAQLEVYEPQNVKLTIGKIWGKTLLFVHAGPTFVYDIQDNWWYEWSTDLGVFLLAGASSGDGRVFGISNTLTTSKIYELDTDTPVYQDDGGSYTMTIQTSKIDFMTDKQKRWHKLRIIGDQQSSTATTGLSWSDDDYNTFSTARNVDMSQARAYLTQVGGIHRRRALRITNSTNTPWRGEAIELDYSLLWH